MNREQFSQFWGQLQQPLKGQWGKLTDEDLLQIGGDLGKFNSTVAARYGEMKDEVIKWANRRYARWTGWYEGYEEAKPTA
ncbi:MAG: general stress protein CsbD [Nitrospirae bacterium]|jgi:uncharacterized protein YjbJ (UPF0337 family)|nr:general stress protein CsbD [Nitrospirota bacterium]